MPMVISANLLIRIINSSHQVIHTDSRRKWNLVQHGWS